MAVDESICRYTVSYQGYGGQPLLKILYTEFNIVNWIILAIVASALTYPLILNGLNSAMLSVDNASASVKEQMKNIGNRIAFEQEQVRLRTNKVEQTFYETPPMSGAYVGSTVESDGVQQGVKVNLNFKDGNKLFGRDTDSIDGKYTLKGSWTADRVEWVETYQGSTPPLLVTVKGFRADVGKFSCFFESSEGVTGRFYVSHCSR